MLRQRATGRARRARAAIVRARLHRGVVTWNRSAKDVRGGAKRQRRRDVREWIRREAPELAIISPELAAAIDARLRSAAATFPRGVRGVLTGGAVQAPGYASPYLLTNFARCASCGGPIGTITRSPGTGAKLLAGTVLGMHHARSARAGDLRQPDAAPSRGAR